MSVPDSPEVNEDGGVPEIGISEALRALPLCEELYLGMQAMNLGLVDDYLGQLEAELLNEYMEIERTPSASTMFVSALSQMWVFALYEFLRTWRQRAKAILDWANEFRATPGEEQAGRLAAKKQEIEKRSADPSEAAVFYWPAFVAAAKTPGFADELRKTVDKTERLFRRIEALRVTLAKHEVPRGRGAFAMAPGYGRIDTSDGSIYWQVLLSDDEVDVVSRHGIADDCRRLALNRDALILPEHVQEKVTQLPNHSYGVKRVAVVLNDGTSYSGVHVAWSKEVLFVEGHDSVPFEVAQVVDVQPDPLLEDD